MKFLFNSQEHRIHFQYDTVAHNDPTRKFRDHRQETRKVTTVRIRTGERDTPSEHVVAVGTSTCNPVEGFNYDTIRKAALRDALAYLPVVFRTAAWTAYHERQGGLWNRQGNPDVAVQNEQVCSASVSV